jgi:hypothetical protein
MTGISIIIVTSGSDDDRVHQIIDSIEIMSIPEYEILVVGGLTTTIDRSNTIHVPFDESSSPAGRWLTKKKNLGVKHSKYDVLVIMHDYHVFEPDWYIEFEKFGMDWDICVHQIRHSVEQASIRGNGWRVGTIPGYPEIPYAMTIPWDIDCFIPYMAIQGAHCVAKKHVLIEQPLSESLIFGDPEDIEWSSRVVPGWEGKEDTNVRYNIVANPNCRLRFNKFKPTYPGNPNWDLYERSMEPLWNFLRSGGRRSGTYHYERSINKVVRAP